MTREELKEHCIRQITEFERIKEIMPVTPNGYKHYEEHKMVLSLIEALEQEPCEDCISREELLKAIDTWDKFGCDADTKLVPYKDHYIPYVHYDDVVKCIKDMPSVTPKERTGRWIVHPKGIYAHLVCNKCLSNAPYDCQTNYCPNCGAKMEVEE